MASNRMGADEQAVLVQEGAISLGEDDMRAIVERNALLTVNRVPEDVLIVIFSRFVVSKGLQHVRDWAQRSEDAIRISHVCHRWRSVATEYPALWNVILIGSKGRATTFLERARSRGVSVAVKSPMLCTDGIAVFLSAHMDRIERLDLYDLRYNRASAPSARTRWMEQWSPPAPALRYLKLHFSSSVSARDTEGLRMFNGTTPALRTLDLSGVMYSASSPFFQDLVELKIDGDNQVFSSRSLLDIMAHCPGLERVKLRCIEPADYDDVRVSIALPRLSELVVFQASHLLWQFIPHLVLPPTSQVRVGLIQLEDTFSPLLRALSAVHHVAQLICPVDADREFWTYTVASDLADPPPLSPDYRTPRTLCNARTILHLQYAAIHGAPQAVPWPADVCAVCDAATLTSHTVFDYYDFFDSEEKWRVQLRRLTRLAVLCVFGPSADSMPRYPQARHTLSAMYNDATRGYHQVPAIPRDNGGIIALVSALGRDPALCPALARLEFDHPTHGVRGRELARALEELVASRPGFVPLRVASPLLDMKEPGHWDW